ncbi:UNVERIFIED_CONTAM: hypothetical protein BEN50_13865 [Euhalothece sp. KZN 001]
MGNYHSNRYRQSKDISLEIFPLLSQDVLGSVEINLQQNDQGVEIQENKFWTINGVDSSKRKVATTITNFTESNPTQTSSHQLFNFGLGTEVIDFSLTEKSQFNITLLIVSEFEPLDTQTIIKVEEFLNLLRLAKRSKEILFFKKNMFLGRSGVVNHYYSVTAFNGIVANLTENTKDKGLTTVNFQINSTSSIIEDVQFSLSPLIHE